MRAFALAFLAAFAAAAVACRAPGAARTPEPDPATTTPPPSPGFTTRSVEVDGATYRYSVYAPVERRGRLPVILFLHGSGERGSDGVLPTFVGLGPEVKAREGRFPAIVVFPQGPAGSSWTGAPARAAMRALEASIAEFEGDRDRVYLTGVSLGGFGTWDIAAQHPGVFAAIVPVCGGARQISDITMTGVPAGTADTNAWAASKLAAMPTWIFHGAADGNVNPEYSRGMYAAMRAAGAPVHYTEYPGVGHNSWESAYAEPALWRWMFAQRLRRGTRGTVIGAAVTR